MAEEPPYRGQFTSSSTDKEDEMVLCHDNHITEYTYKAYIQVVITSAPSFYQLHF